MYDDDERGVIDGSRIFDRDTGLPRLLAEQCSTCIYRPGNPMHLRSGRLREITNAARQADSFITCHQTLPGVSGEAPALCRGFYDRWSTNFIRVMGRLGGWHEVPAERCVERGGGAT